MDQEIWKDIEDYNGLYQISSFGRVKSIKNGIKKTYIDKYGYVYVSLSKNGKIKRFRVHRLVAHAFLFKPKKASVVNHLDGNKTNNCIDNLEWTTPLENNRHAVRMGLNDCGVKVALLINGKEIKRFKSLADAGRYLGVGRNTIHNQIHNCKHKNCRTNNIQWVLL